MRASWGLNRLWLLQVRSGDNVSVAARVAGITSRCERGGATCACIPAPCLLSCRVFVLGVYALLEPCNLMGEQAHRDLRRGSADLRGGEEHSYGKVERLFARIGAGGTDIVGQEL